MKRLAIFARPPVAGQVKARLSPALPPALAAELYAALLADTLDAARGCAADERTLWWSERPSAFSDPAGFEVHVQPAGDLGARLSHAADHLLRADGDLVLLAGSDLPALRPEHLDEGFAALSGNDLVLGPAADGGLWLAGLARPVRGLFAGIEWGTDRVYTQVLTAAAREGLRVHALGMHDDLGTPHDLVRLVAAAGAAHAPVFGPHALAALRRMGMLPE